MAITQDSHKQGLIWQSSTGQMRYSDKNENDQWIQQIPYYPIAENIKYGNLVTIRDDGKLHLTNSTEDEICIGLALEPGVYSEETPVYIHVQPFGKFTFRRKDEKVGNDNVSEAGFRENFDYDPEFSGDDIGKYAYARYNTPGEIFVGNEQTLQQNQSLIRIGTVVSETELDILIYNSKDRGNVDRNDLFIELGEDVTLFEGFPKVFAIGNDTNQYFSFSLTKTATFDSLPDITKQDGNTFIFLCNKNGKGVRIGFKTPVVTTQSDDDLNYAINSCGLGVSNTSLGINATGIPKAVSNKKGGAKLGLTLNCSESENGLVFTSTSYNGPFYVFLSDELKKYYDLNILSYGSTENRGKAILADIRIPARRNVFGFFDTTNQFSEDVHQITLKKGEKYLFVRSGTISLLKFDGYYKQKDYFNLTAEEQQALCEANSEAGDNVGSPLYLGSMGNLIKHPYVKYGYIDPVATYIGIPNKGVGKDNEHKLIVDCKAPTIFFNDSIPVGYIRQCSVYNDGAKKIYLPDYGHLVASGENAIYTSEISTSANIQKYSIETYRALYNKLKELYEVKTDGDYFYVPEITDSHGNFMEVNWVDRGIFSSPRIEQPYLRRFGTFASDTTKAEIATSYLDNTKNAFNFDITELVNYGVFENSKAAPQLDSFDIHLYIDLNNERFDALGYYGSTLPSHWVEVYPGYYNYNNNQAYGYTWRIITSEGRDFQDPNEVDGNKRARFYLTTFIGDNDKEKGKGICYVASTNEAPYTLEGVKFKVTIARKDNLPRQFDLQCFIDEFEGRIAEFTTDALSDTIKAKIEEDIKKKLTNETGEIAEQIVNQKVEAYGIESVIDGIIVNKGIPNLIQTEVDKYSTSNSAEYNYLKNQLTPAFSEIKAEYIKDINDEYSKVKGSLETNAKKTLEDYIKSRGITQDYLDGIVSDSVKKQNIPTKIDDAIIAKEPTIVSKAQEAISNNLESVYTQEIEKENSALYLKTIEKTKEIAENNSESIIKEALGNINVKEDITIEKIFRTSLTELINFTIGDKVDYAIENQDISYQVASAIGLKANDYKGGYLETAVNGYGIENLVKEYITTNSGPIILETWNVYWGDSEVDGQLKTQVKDLVITTFNNEFTDERIALNKEYSDDTAALNSSYIGYLNSLGNTFSNYNTDLSSKLDTGISDIESIIMSTVRRTESNNIVIRRKLKVDPDEYLGAIPAIEEHRENAISSLNTRKSEIISLFNTFSGFENTENSGNSIKSLINDFFENQKSLITKYVGFSDEDSNAKNLKEFLDNKLTESLNSISELSSSKETDLGKAYTSYYNSLKTLVLKNKETEKSISSLIEQNTKLEETIAGDIKSFDEIKVSIESAVKDNQTTQKSISDDVNLFRDTYWSTVQNVSAKLSSFESNFDIVSKTYFPKIKETYDLLFTEENGKTKYSVIEDVSKFIENKYPTLNKKITDIDTKIDNFSSKLEEDKTTIAGYKAEAEAYKKAAMGYRDDCKKIDDDVTEKIKNIKDFDDEFEIAKSDINELKIGAQSTANSISAIQTSISDLIKLESEIGTTTDNITSINTEISEIEEKLDNIDIEEGSLVLPLSDTGFSIIFNKKDTDDNLDKTKTTETPYIDLDLKTKSFTFGDLDEYYSITAAKFTAASLSKYKRIYGERGLDKFDDWSALFDNSIKYSLTENKNEYTNDYNGLLGSALQAAYEMPLAYWQYNSDHESDKKTLGIIVERLMDITKSDSILHHENQKDTTNNSIATVRKIFKTSNSDKRNSETIKEVAKSDNKYISKAQNEFKYTEEEVKSIKEYIRTITNTDENGENIVSSVGFLFAAAKETQERLLQLEASTFGFDAKTIPGNQTARHLNVIENNSIIPADVLCNDPTSLGLNRLIRALCDEVYHTSNPMNDSDFEIKDNPDSTVSRIDMLDESFHGQENYAKGKARTPSNYYLKDIDSKTYPYSINKSETGGWDKNIETLEHKYTGDSKQDKVVSESGIAKNQFNGAIDAIGRISKKLNQLTIDVHGTDNIDLDNDTTLLCNFSFTYEDYIN